jgi:hypothetical protein
MLVLLIRMKQLKNSLKSLEEHCSSKSTLPDLILPNIINVPDTDEAIV